MNRTELIKQTLKELGLSQRELAQILGYSESALSHFITGRSTSKKFDNLIKKELDIA